MNNTLKDKIFLLLVINMSLCCWAQLGSSGLKGFVKDQNENARGKQLKQRKVMN